MTRALTRSIPASYASALAATPPDPPIDVALARLQHAAYRDGLASLGLEVITLDADERFPDCVFIEDTALVAGGVALITRSGAPSRRGEVEAVAPALARFVEVVPLSEPATLDGGDCMRVGRVIYVGRSARTNAAGVAAVRDVFTPRGYTVVEVAMPPEVLHLKCVCSPLGDDRILLAEGSLPPSIFPGTRIVWVPAAETYAANAVAYGDGVLMSAGFPRAHAAAEAAGLRVIPIAATEMRKADGSLTCMSILV
jgi:dimethylargininase